MGSGSDNIFTKYIMPGLQTAIGAGSEVVAPGNPVGISLIGSGAGSLAGGAAGGPQGQSIGSGLGGFLGGLGGSFGQGGSALGGSLGLPGVSDSAVGDILGSVNPGSGVDAGIAPAGGGKGSGGLSSLMGSTGGGAKSLDSLNSLVGPLAGIFKPQGQGQQQTPPQSKEINPVKGPGPQPQLPTPPPTAIGGKVGPESIDPRIMAILARLRR